MNNIQADQYETLRKNFDLDEIYNFTLSHRVDVTLQLDQQYHCFIDFEEGDGSWAIDIDPLSAIMNAVTSFKKKSKSE